MKIVEVYKNDVCTDRVNFESDEEVKEFLSYREKVSPFGLPQRWKEESECSKEEMASSLSAQKREMSDGVVKAFYLLPAEFEVKVLDYEVPKEVLLKQNVQKEIDPCDFMCAMMEKDLGDGTAYKLLLEKYEKCKKEVNG